MNVSPTARPTSGPVVIVGAGLAGLVCAGKLLAAGRHVVVLEAEHTAGGRVRTEVTPDGFRIDRGFQVLFSAYPALRRNVPLAALEPQYFGAGIQYMVDRRPVVLGHPVFAPATIPSSVRSGLITGRDLRALLISVLPGLRLGDGPLSAADRSIRAELSARGASDRCIDRVIAPLFGGISLDRSLSSDATFWRFVVRALLLGRVFLPKYGVGQLTHALASRLPQCALRLNTRVTEVIVEDNRVVRVVAGSEEWRPAAVVLATEAPVAHDLAGTELPAGRRGCTTAYFSSDEPVSTSRFLMVNSEPSLVNHAVQLTNISRAYAPAGKHLLSATSLDIMTGDDSAVGGAMVRDMIGWLPHVDRLDPEPVAVVSTPYAQFAQDPGVYRRLPGPRTPVEGLFLAGEFLHSSSVQGAMRGGELAAAAVLGRHG